MIEIQNKIALEFTTLNLSIMDSVFQIIKGIIGIT